MEFPYLSQVFPKELMEQMIDAILQREEPIRMPSNISEQKLVKLIADKQKLNSIQLILRKVMSANLKYIPLKTAFSFLFENKYTAPLADGPLSQFNPYASNLNERLSLLKQLRFNLKIKEKSETNSTIKAELQKVLDDTEKELKKYE
jgi:hypothetical protein